jgi:transposase InsO family protein
MDLLMKEGARLAPKDKAEAIAVFRMQVIGPLLTRAFASHGDLASAIRALSRELHKPPTSSTTRTYSEATIERWYYRYKKRGLAGITPRRRSDTGHARELTDAQRDLLLAIRRENPTTSTALILRTLETDGRLAKNAVSLSTVGRLYTEHGLDRVTLRVADGRLRLRWQADRVDALWHADVCHGPAMKVAGRTVPLRIHAILDDHSRYIVAIVATTTEREVEMLSLLVKAMRATGRRPEALYLDNGATYRGDVLATACSRLGIGLLHATPHDPQARGKMERFWRTLREGCLDHLGMAGSLHDVQVRLLAFLAKHYHIAPHASLMGKAPGEVYETAPRYDESVDDAALGAALTVHARRRVRRDGTLEIGGVTFETRTGFLAGRVVTVGRSLLDPSSDPWIEHESERYLLGRVDAEQNARRKKAGPSPNRPRNGIDVPFDPAGALLDALVGRGPDRQAGAR